MVVTVDALERAGLAERRPHPTDRRARVIAVTAAGRRRLADAEAIMENVREAILQDLSASERKTFVTSLKRMTEARPV